MSEVVAAHSLPSAPLDSENGVDLMSDVQALMARVENSGIATLLGDLVAEMGERLEQERADSAGGGASAAAESTLAPPRHTQQLSGDAVAHATRICPGWEEPKPDAEANGVVRLTATLSETGLDPVLWGAPEQCHLLVAEQRVLLETAPSKAAALSIHVGEGLDFSELGTMPLTFDIDLKLTVEDESDVLDLDFQVDTMQQSFQFRLARGNGFLLVVLGADGALNVRATNGDFSCDRETLMCSNGDLSVTLT